MDTHGMDVHCDLEYPSTTLFRQSATLASGKPPGGRRRRRRAAEAGGRKLYGEYATTSLRLTLRGKGQWMEVWTPAGRFFIDPDCSVRALHEQVRDGGHWVLDEGPPARG